MPAAGRGGWVLCGAWALEESEVEPSWSSTDDGETVAGSTAIHVEGDHPSRGARDVGCVPSGAVLHGR